MKFFLGIVCVILLPLLSLAQGSLTIFSEDGDKFLLFLNGAQQSIESHVNLRVDGLSQADYKARIVFDDLATVPVETAINVADTASGKRIDLVCKMKNNGGRIKLTFFPAQPVRSDYTPPGNVYVVHYGQPDQVADAPQTPPSNTGQGNGTIEMGFGGGGVNITAPDTKGAAATAHDNDGNKQPQIPLCKNPMDGNSFKPAKESVANEKYDDNKLAAAKAILNNNCLSTDEVMQLCKLFGFDSNKLAFAKSAYSKTTDPANYSKLVKVFDYEAAKKDMSDFIKNAGR